MPFIVTHPYNGYPFVLDPFESAPSETVGFAESSDGVSVVAEEFTFSLANAMSLFWLSQIRSVKAAIRASFTYDNNSSDGINASFTCTNIKFASSEYNVIPPAANRVAFDKSQYLIHAIGNNFDFKISMPKYVSATSQKYFMFGHAAANRNSEKFLLLIGYKLNYENYEHIEKDSIQILGQSVPVILIHEGAKNIFTNFSMSGSFSTDLNCALIP